MYFFDEEEHEKLTKFFLPRTREMTISDDLRGWSWNHPPLEPIYDLKMTVSEISSRYCPTNRDLYLNRVQGVKVPPNEAMISGSIFHSYLCGFILNAKRLLYHYGLEGREQALNELESVSFDVPQRFKQLLTEDQINEISKKLVVLHRHEFLSFSYRLEKTLSRQPYIGLDALVATVLPVVVEQKLDGSRLGLSQYLSCDAVYLSEPVLLDLKFGTKQDFHFLGLTGYGLVVESLFEYPVNICCTVYVSFNKDSLRVEKEFRILSDELRQAFIEERDEKMRMIFEEIDPGWPDECYKGCPYSQECKRV